MEKRDFIKLSCGAVAEVVIPAECADVEVLVAKSEDAAREKHVPYVEEVENGYLVKVGKEAKHPMMEAHWIQLIEIEVDGNMLYRKYLNPGEEPEALFEVPKGKVVVAREYCNLHGLWASK